MKTNIHPDYNKKVKYVCASCGSEFVLGSTLSQSEVVVPVCKNCHPAYTGQQQIIIDTANKIRAFQKRQAKTEQLKRRMQEIEEARQAREKSRVGVIASKSQQTTLKDLLLKKNIKSVS
ncbi:MAG: hypothetical protein KatS3mg084_0086 [Candidatus Dojkabacteria bacterium]|nr:MAG: hypothetical protein KatS3mg084_0086 [Candidatus Dojkabacteria bacterium]